MSKLMKVSFKLLDLFVIFMLTFGSPMSAVAYTWTDPTDAPPGSVVTIYGDNSDGALYLPGERVSVIAVGPNVAPYDFMGSCLDANDNDPEVAVDGSWSCTITLPADPAISVGTWTYTTLGSISQYSETGSFTDAQGNFSKPYAHWSDEPLPGDWNNNILNDNKSNYFEGEVIPHVFMYGASNNAQLVNGQSYSFNVTYNYYQQNTDAGGFAYMTQYNLSRQPHVFDWSTPAITPTADSAFTNDGGMAAGASFYTVDADITSISAVTYTGALGQTRDGIVTITFTYTGTTTSNGYAAVYYGLYVAKPGEVPDQGKGKTNGANAWSGGSLQTTVDIGGSGATSIQLAPSAIIAGEISGLKFNDLNGNGSKDVNESGLAGWTICLDSDSDPNNGNLGCVLTSNGTTDDQDGNGEVDPVGFYYFSVTPGTYYVYEVNQNGWTQTAPSTVYYGPLVVSATTAMYLNNNFGNSYNTGSLKITKNTSNPSGATLPASFTGTYDCGGGYSGNWSVPDGGSQTFSGIPTGSVCTVSEVTPDPIPGYTWGPITYTPSSVIIGTNTTVEIVVGNSITRDYNADLTVTKTATPFFARTFTWDITKDVDGTKKFTAGGGPATFDYTVNVTHDNGTDTGFIVSGVITVANSNDFDIEGVNITDSIDNGGTCTVTDGTNVTIPANSSVDRNYSCSFASNPGFGTNTATATWDKDIYYTPSGSATGTAGYAFTTPTTIVDGSVEVTDSLYGDLGTVSYTDASPTEFKYSLTFNDPAGTCTSHTNTATFTTNTTGTTGSASQTVTDCQGADLTVTKTATPFFTRTFAWDITKDVDGNKKYTAGGGPATFNYTVGVTHDAGTDSAWYVTGTITVTNPNDWQDIVTTVTDAAPGGTCTVTGGVNVTVPAGKSVELPYTCTFTTGASGTNTATATWDKDTYSTPTGSATGTAGYAFVTPTTPVDEEVTVTDDLYGPLGTVSYNDPSPTEFKYSLTFEDPAGTCTSHTNTATFTTNTTGTTGSASQTVTDCQGADLKVTKTATPSFTRTWNWKITKDYDGTYNLFAGQSVTHGYEVTVTPDPVDSDWIVSGTIHVVNPNDWQAITFDVSDAVPGGDCTVTGGTSVEVEAGGFVDLTYSCTFADQPDYETDLTNTATVTWDKDAYHTPTGSASGDKRFQFTDPTTVINPVITVDDSNLNDEDWSADRAYAEWSYTKDFACSTNPEDYKTGSYSYTIPNTATITETGQSDDASVTVNCSSKDLVVTKTATPSFTRTFDWTIDKSADKTTVYSAGGGESEPVNYTVKVTKDAGTDSAWAISGTITVHNPNPFDVTGVSLSDATPGGTCTVTPATVNVSAGQDATATYTCTFTSNPLSGTNTATADWFENDGSGIADYEFGAPTTLVHDAIDVTDTNGKTWHFTGSSSETYQMTFKDPAGICTAHENTATIDQLGKSDSVTVEDCQGVDLTVTKTVTTAYTRTFTWTITKSVDKTKVILEGAQPQSATFNYTVAVSHDAGIDSGWTVTGTIKVSNPNDWQDIITTVTDIAPGGTCTVTGGVNVTVPAGKSVELPYTCTFTAGASGTNTAKATWDKDTYSTPNGSATGTENYAFTTPTTIVDGSVTVVDDKTDPNNPVTLGTASYTQSNPIKFTYSLTKPGVSGTCTDYTNTATFTTNTTGTTGSDSQTVTACSSNVSVYKLTRTPGDPAPWVDTSKNWIFNLYGGPDGFGGTVLATDTTLNDSDGVLDFDFYNLNPAKTYTICELSVPSGYTAEWKIDTNGDGTPDTVVIPYNPNSNDTVPQDLGNRCFDFGAGTSYPIPEGGTLAFQVINEYPGGAPRTPGYWKNWNRCTGGGQAANADRQGGRAEGYTLLEDILTSPGIIWDDISTDSFPKVYPNNTVKIDTCEYAVEILDQRVVILNGKVGDGKKLASDAARTLAMHLLAAQLNEGNGACINQDVKDVILKAETLLDKLNFDGKKTTAYLTTKSADYAYALKLAAYLDAYNNSDCKFNTLPPKP